MFPTYLVKFLLGNIASMHVYVCQECCNIQEFCRSVKVLTRLQIREKIFFQGFRIFLFHHQIFESDFFLPLTFPISLSDFTIDALTNFLGWIWILILRTLYFVKISCFSTNSGNILTLIISFRYMAAFE